MFKCIMQRLLLGSFLKNKNKKNEQEIPPNSPELQSAGDTDRQLLGWPILAGARASYSGSRR